MEEITLKILLRILRLDNAGNLIWHAQGIDMFDTPQDAEAWNAKHAGQPVNVSASGRVRILGASYDAAKIVQAIKTGKMPAVRKRRRYDVMAVNRSKRKQANNTSGHAGVTYSKNAQKWQAKIGDGGRYRHLGYFENMPDAVAARIAAEQELGYGQWRKKA